MIVKMWGVRHLYEEDIVAIVWHAVIVKVVY